MEFIRRIFGRGNPDGSEDPDTALLSQEELERIGTPEDPLASFEAGMERNIEAAEAEQNGDTAHAVELYERSVAEEFPGSHPYERLADLYERRGDHESALRVCEAYAQLARSGRLPRGAQRSADRKMPGIEARAEHYRRSLEPQEPPLRLEDVRIAEFDESYSNQVKRLVTEVHNEFGFSYDPLLDADLDAIGDIYSGRSMFWVALGREGVIGTVAILERTQETAELKRMYLLSPHRGKGLGLALLEHAMRFAKSQHYAELLLDTTQRQQGAIRLYRRFGFQETKRDGETLYYKLAL